MKRYYPKNVQMKGILNVRAWPMLSLVHTNVSVVVTTMRLDPTYRYYISTFLLFDT